MLKNFCTKKICLAFCLVGFISPVLADSFTIKEVVIEGIERIGYETVYTYLPVSVGEELDVEKEQASIRALYRTGFFQDVALFKGNSGQLIVRVEERPSIAQIEIKGNKLIKTDDLMTALDSLGIKQGKIYNAIEMDRVIIDLKRQYHNQGYYAADIKIEVESLARNRVDLKIIVDEGEAASIERIALVGNNTYSDERLKGLFLLSESVIMGSGDKYARPKLQSDLETLRSFYMDRGFAEFNINSSQVSLSADKTKVFISASLTEGPQYRLDNIKFTCDGRLSQDELRKLINLESGELFSRTKIIAAINTIRDRLSEEGYAFAEVEPRTKLNPDTQTVDLDFYIESKNRVYVRRVEVEGNTRTRDHVLRREMRQYESAPYSLAAVRQSTSRLNRLGYFTRVNIDTRRVSDDEVDLVIQVEEQSTGSFTAGIGYSQLDGVSFNIGVSERNWLGTGNELNITANSSASTKSADIGFTNPYFTDDGVSLGAGFYLYEVNAAELGITNYTVNNKGFRLNLGYPTSELTRLNFGLKVENQVLNCSGFSTCIAHAEQYGFDNNYALFTAGWRYDSRNSFYFPTSGQLTSVSFQSIIPETSDVTFYKTFFEERLFIPLSKNFTLKLGGTLAYGAGYGDYQDKLPFYERFYAGGIGSVRGFEPNSLGDYYDLTLDGSNRPKGGDARTLFSTELVFPMPLIEDSSNLRLSWFFDAGNIFSAIDEFESAQLRSATGLAFSWLTPVGPLAFSFSKPIHYKKEDQLQSFQFSLGVPF